MPRRKIYGRIASVKPSIAWKKFWRGLAYTMGATLVTYLLNFIGGLQVSPEQAVYVGIIVSVLQAVKKLLERYDPKKDR